MENNNPNPFAIRLEVLKMAQELLMNKYYEDKEIINSKWHMDCDEAKLKDIPIPNQPKFPPFPTENQIIEKAKTFNDFISNKS